MKIGSYCAGGPCCEIKHYPDPSNQSHISSYCEIKLSGTICRSESTSCDLPEYCDGQSQWCPVDVYKADGELCYTNEGEQVGN